MRIIAILSLFCILFLHSRVALSQPQIEWQDCFGGSGSETTSEIIRTNDNGYVIIGCSGSANGDADNNHGWQDVWVVKFDSAFLIQWQHNFGGSDNDLGVKIIQTADSGFLFSANTSSNDGDISYFHGNSDAWIVKLDVYGNLEWEKTFGGTLHESAAGLVELSDNEYLFSGTTSSQDGDVSGNHGSDDVWIVKFDEAGNIIWQKCFGGPDSDFGTDNLQQLNDGNFLLLANTLSNNGDVSGNHGEVDAWVIKIDSAGSLLWQHCYGGTDNDRLHYFIENSTGFVFAGQSSSNNGDVTGNHGNGDYWVFKTDTAGSITNTKCFGGFKREFAGSIVPLPGGNFSMIGITESNDGDVSGNHNPPLPDIWLIGFDSLLQLQWTKCFGSIKNERCYTMLADQDAKLIIAASTETPQPDGDVTCALFQYSDYWIFRVNTECADTTVAGFLFQQTDLSVAFTDLSINADFWFWDFGDGTTSNNQSPTHEYAVPGSYTVCLIAGDSCASDTLCETINIVASSTGNMVISNPEVSISPNPFSSSTTIQFSLENNSPLKIELFDLQGRKIKTIAEGNFSAGNHTLNFSADDLPGGIYLLNLKTAFGIKSQKLIIQ